MSSPEDVTLARGERVYTFISDPGHKETLSGRVRAACLTCRRKKIKCSGDEPCQTCQERGLACEGLPARKRPKRQQIYPWVKEEISPGSSTTRLQNDAVSSRPMSNAVQRAAGLKPKLLNDADRHDSSYGSIIYQNSESNSPEPQHDSPSDRSIQSSPVLGNDLSRVASLNGASRAYMNPAQIGMSGARNHLLNAQVRNATSHGIDQTDGRDRSDLLVAAQMLEQHANSLRELATRQEIDGLASPGRRQTVVFPMVESTTSPGGSSVYTTQDSVDDLALLFPGCLPTPRGTGSTSNMEYFSNWLGHITAPGGQQVTQPPANVTAAPMHQNHKWPNNTFEFATPPFTTADGTQPSAATAGENGPAASRGKQVADANSAYLFSKASQRPWPY